MDLGDETEMISHVSVRTCADTISGSERLTTLQVTYPSSIHAELLATPGLVTSTAKGNYIDDALVPRQALISATNWGPFLYAQDVSREMAGLQRVVGMALEAGAPKQVEPGDWHLPFIDGPTLEDAYLFHSTKHGDPTIAALLTEATCIQLSAVRCTSVGLEAHVPPIGVQQEIGAYNRRVLVMPLPVAWAHVAQADGRLESGTYTCHGEHGEFRGWRQYRRQFVGFDRIATPMGQKAVQTPALILPFTRVADPLPKNTAAA